MRGIEGASQIGRIVATAHAGQRTPASYAAELTNRIISVGDQAPEPIRQQAHAFRDRVEAVVRGYIAAAVAEQRDYDAGEAERMGAPAVAAAIRARR